MSRSLTNRTDNREEPADSSPSLAQAGLSSRDVAPYDDGVRQERLRVGIRLATGRQKHISRLVNVRRMGRRWQHACIMFYPVTLKLTMVLSPLVTHPQLSAEGQPQELSSRVDYTCRHG